MRGWLSLGIVFALALSVAIVACGDDDDDDSNNGEGDDAVQEITLRADDTLVFEPSELQLRVGERVRLTLDNSENSTLHDFTVDHMDVEDVHGEGAMHGDHGEMAALHIAMDPGMHGDLEFTPTEAGTYEFYCSEPGHADAGMKGTIVVEE